jgi:hypothetical protein
MSLFNGIGKKNRGEGNDIDRTDFASGYALYMPLISVQICRMAIILT